MQLLAVGGDMAQAEKIEADATGRPVNTGARTLKENSALRQATQDSVAMRRAQPGRWCRH